MQDPFFLDPLLAGDTVPLASLALCELRLMDDANYPWLILIPRRPAVAEIAELGPADRTALIDEIALASEVLTSAVPCDKVNVGALGNLVRQLHVHVVARKVADAAWPGPVWGKVPRIPYDPLERAALVVRLQAALAALSV